MNGALVLSIVLAANSLESVLVVVLVILAVLVVIAIVGALFMLMRRRGPDESAATVESTAPAPPPPPSSAPVTLRAGAGDAFASRPAVGPPAATSPSSPAVSTVTPEPEATTAEPQAETPEQAESRDPEPVPPVEPDPGKPVRLQVLPPVEPPVPAADEEKPAAQAGSTTQTPEDVDQRSPAELAAAAQAAAAGEDDQDAGDGSRPGTAIQSEVTIGPPRPVVAPAPPDPARLRMLGLTLGMLTERMRREHQPQLGTALARLVDSDQEGARAQLSTLALSLLGEDEEPAAGDGQLGLFLEEALEGEMQRGTSLTSMPEFQQALTAVAPELHEKLQTIVWARNADSVAILTAEDIEALERVAMAMATALILDTSYDVRRLPGEAPPGRS